MGTIRKNIIDGQVDEFKKADLLREYAYFASVAPQSLMSKLGLGKNKEQGDSGKNPFKSCLMTLLTPLWICLFIVSIPILIIVAIIRSMTQNPEYKNYNFSEKIVEPTLRLFDDELTFGFNFDPSEVADGVEDYNQALVEARLVKPFGGYCRTSSNNNLSYRWDDKTDTDSFEATTYRLYDEWDDDDGGSHETVYFNGAIYKFHLSYSVNGSVNIMSTKTKKNILGMDKEKNQFKKIKDRKEVVINTGNQAFDESFDTVATYNEEAFKFLTPSMIETLLELRNNYFFSICIKDNVLTVAIDEKPYGKASHFAISKVKPYSAPKDPAADLEDRITLVRNYLTSIYELKDRLDPIR